MLTWLKGLFANPKAIVTIAIDALDYAAPLLAKEIDGLKDRPFNKMSSLEQAQFAIDWVQDHMRKFFKIDA